MCLHKHTGFVIPANLVKRHLHFVFHFIVILIMPPKRAGKKSRKPSSRDSSLLSKFCRSNKIPEDVMDVLVQNHITSKSFLAAISEQDLADMGFVASQKILLHPVISRL